MQSLSKVTTDGIKIAEAELIVAIRWKGKTYANIIRPNSIDSIPARIRATLEIKKIKLKEPDDIDSPKI